MYKMYMPSKYFFSFTSLDEGAAHYQKIKISEKPTHF